MKKNEKNLTGIRFFQASIPVFVFILGNIFFSMDCNIRIYKRPAQPDYIHCAVSHIFSSSGCIIFLITKNSNADSAEIKKDREAPLLPCLFLVSFHRHHLPSVIISLSFYSFPSWIQSDAR